MDILYQQKDKDTESDLSWPGEGLSVGYSVVESTVSAEDGYDPSERDDRQSYKHTIKYNFRIGGA